MKNCTIVYLLLLLASILVLTAGCSDAGQAPAILIPGPQGPKGDQGDVGAPGETGPTGNDGQDGATGPSGQDGNDGAVGPQGPAGSNGQDGSNGHDATSVYSVQFCANQGTTTYGHFPEQGICIDHKLYAVYWDGHNAFLAEIAPGNYRTTSTGLICNFTVAANCVVTQ